MSTAMDAVATNAVVTAITKLTMARACSAEKMERKMEKHRFRKPSPATTGCRTSTAKSALSTVSKID